MKKNHSGSPKAHFIAHSEESGAATLLVTIIMLLTVTIFMLYSNRSTFIEQKTVNNQIKRAQAFEAAQSGLDSFVAKLLDTNNTTVASTYLNGSSGAYTGIKTAYSNSSSVINGKGYLNSNSTALFHDFTNINTTTLRTASNSSNNFSGITITAPTGVNQLLSYSIYLVDLGGGRIRVFSRGCADVACPTSQTATSTAYSEAVVSVDVNTNGQSRCAIEVNNSLTITNNASVNGYTDTGVCGVALGNTPIVNGGGNTHGTNYDVQSCTSSCGYTNTSPPTFAQSGVKTNGYNAVPDSYFTNYFGQSPTTIRDSASTRIFTGDATGTNLCAELASARSAGKRILWITGNLTLSSSDNSSYGPSYCPQNGYAPGVYEATVSNTPVTVIVGGMLDVAGVAWTFDGLLYVRGNASSSSSATGTIHSQGAVAFEGSVTGNLSMNVTAQSSWLSLLPFPPQSSAGSKLKQTWKDF